MYIRCIWQGNHQISSIIYGVYTWVWPTLLMPVTRSQELESECAVSTNRTHVRTHIYTHILVVSFFPSAGPDAAHSLNLPSLQRPLPSIVPASQAEKHHTLPPFIEHLGLSLSALPLKSVRISDREHHVSIVPLLSADPDATCSSHSLFGTCSRCGTTSARHRCITSR